MTAVISSALMGMTTGQATPNIAVTGAFTIPLMKRVGYRPEVAASVEAAASGGAQIMPPIMGAGAFVMADLLGVPYADIIASAAIPATLYFISVGFFVHFSALKSRVAPLTEQPDRAKLWATAPLFVLPVLAIVLLFFWGYPAMFAAFWGIVGLLLLSVLRRRTRPPLAKVIDGCVRGAVTGAKVAVACATLGPIIALVTKTGLGMLVGYSVEAWSGGSLFLALAMSMGCVIILGLEVPTVAAYLGGGDGGHPRPGAPGAGTYSGPYVRLLFWGFFRPDPAGGHGRHSGQPHRRGPLHQDRLLFHGRGRERVFWCPTFSPTTAPCCSPPAPAWSAWRSRCCW